ncbi:MAG: PBP1A family penicillin-binding protein [Lachnospiraceae bacterium]|nr:PBP1A family penicillin-binding protein [Lachnospiraceae bacterium]MEE1014388.1 PBP1A family penicillin-binding protein [Lachnospiraceae bacterium]
MNYSKKETSKKQKALRSKKKKVGKKLSVIFLKAFLVCMIAVVVIIGCAGVGIIKGVIDNAPDITSESVIPKGYKSTVYDSEGNKMQELIASGTNRTMITLDQVPEHVQNAFIAIEDERFYEHNGIDIQGILRAGVTFVTSGFDKRQGASTITQQLLKNNVFDFMSEETLADSIERKIQEQYLAIKLEETMSKEEILQAYLNTINLGQNTLGIQAASNRYFGKDVSELTIAEGAVLAGVAKNPEGYNPIKNPEDNKTRTKLVLNNMLEQELITQKEYEEALQEDVYSHIKTVNETVTESAKVNSYFTDAVVEEVLEDLKELKGYSDTQAYNMLYGGGLKIYTTMDPEIQAIMDEELANPDNFPNDYKIGLEYAMTTIKEDGTTTNYSQEMMQAYFKEKNGTKTYDLIFADEEAAQAAIDEYEATVIEEGDTVYRNVKMTVQPQVSMVVMDQATGEVKGILGGRGEKTASLTLNRATSAVRQPGSTFKIVAAYAPALDAAGMSLATTQYDGPYMYEGGTEIKQVRNWNGEAYEGWTTLRRGIEQSMNIVAAKTYTQNGSALGLSYLDKFGFTTIQKQADTNGNNDYGPAVALGGLTNGVTNLELTAAYAAIANAGYYQEPIFYTKIEDSEGNLIIDKTSDREEHQAVSEETAWLLTSAMKDVVNQGTGGALKLNGMTTAGKTGTTSDYRDLWFVGYTPYYTAGVWAGYDIPTTKLAKSERNYHKSLWKKVMTRIHEELENKDFEKPEDIIQVAVCSESGKLPVAGLCDCDQRGSCVVTEYFAKGTEPTESCDVHIMAKVCPVTGQLATDACYWPQEQVRVILPVLQEGAPDNPTLDTAYGVSMQPEYTCSTCTGGAQVQSITVTENYDRLQSITSARKQ